MSRITSTTDCLWWLSPANRRAQVLPVRALKLDLVVIEYSIDGETIKRFGHVYSPESEKAKRDYRHRQLTALIVRQGMLTHMDRVGIKNPWDVRRVERKKFFKYAKNEASHLVSLLNSESQHAEISHSQQITRQTT